MRVALIGLGRMGQRHLAGILASGAAVTVVSRAPDLRGRAVCAAVAAVPGRQHFGVERIDDLTDDVKAAVVSGTADLRPGHFRALAERGIRHLLLEKPLCQSRTQLGAMLDTGAAACLDVMVNFPYREDPLFGQGGPWGPETMDQRVSLSVNGGALGFGCNSIHWIDLFRFLTKGRSLQMTYARILPEPIASGRGPQFGDYGGTAVFEGESGDTLMLRFDPTSSTPASATLISGHRKLVLDLESRNAISYRRRPGSLAANYQYAKDHDFEFALAPALPDPSDRTRRWVEAVCGRGPFPAAPTLVAAAAAHDLLFDLLDASGRTTHPIT